MTRGRLSSPAVSRRRVLQMIGAAPAAVMAVSLRAAEPVKVGLIVTTSGPFASSGDIMLKAAQLFMNTRAAGVLGGQQVQLVVRDDGGANPEVAKRLVQELVTRDRVQYLGGFQWTPNANAVAPLVSQAKVPCVLMNAGAAPITRLSPYFVRTSFTTWQSSYHLGRWAAGRGIKNVYVLVTDFAPGHDCEAAFMKGFSGAGRKIVATVRMPIQSPNFVPFLQRARAAKPDAVFAFHPGGVQTTSFMKAYAEAGLREQGIMLIGPGDLTSDEELPSLGALAQGVITAHHYSLAADRPANKTFVAAWQKAYGVRGVRPNYMAVGVWDGMHAICAAVAATKGAANATAAMQALSRFRSTDSPRGPMQIDPATRDIIQNMYIREVRMANGAPANVEIETFANVKDPWKELNPA